jgi:hypothetical protein
MATSCPPMIPTAATGHPLHRRVAASAKPAIAARNSAHSLLSVGRSSPADWSSRWPENQAWPALQLGPFVGFLTTTASMVAFINSIVAGVGVALLVGRLFPEQRTLFASLIGAGVALLLMALFLLYQKWRYAAVMS